MHVYLVQHGEALSSEENPARPLSAKGEENVRRMGDFLYKHSRLVVPEVLHSGKERTAQTAAILAGCHNAFFVAAASGLKPADDPALWALRLEPRSEDVMLVGHLPHLQRLAGLLLCNDEALPLIRFRNACVVCLERDEARAWHIKWMMTPELLPD